ncbi:pimeloyl-ACP methyl ester carboxylesterase [Rhizobium sp. BK313]|uniref:alpha/beta fold hydrolase n=1 Tax=Rhizobium sp. BK313 TaxID=2587081 RepID=UPI001062080E|nr:alpha/beta hydrolase [Rhizobium sp. BK313]MBB3459419.1 pimeloyl-ACP methyl ester carboxylesterase [Rhizobium sp. BK313]
MPLLRLDDAQIYYEVSGSGYPVLLFAPGFLSSRIERWQINPSKPGVVQDWCDPVPVFSQHFKVIAFDVRNAGRSRGTIDADYDWDSYTRDHIALLRHLGVERCHVMGACIGVSFALSLEEKAPGTTSAMVLQNPIGLSDVNRPVVDREIGSWSAGIANRPDVDPRFLSQVAPRMFGGDYVFSTTRDFTERCGVPTLLMPGNDTMHPVTVSADIARLTGAEVVDPWKGPDYRDAAIARARDFFIEHTPGGCC